MVSAETGRSLTRSSDDANRWWQTCKHRKHGEIAKIRHLRVPSVFIFTNRWVTRFALCDLDYATRRNIYIFPCTFSNIDSCSFQAKRCNHQTEPRIMVMVEKEPQHHNYSLVNYSVRFMTFHRFGLSVA